MTRIDPSSTSLGCAGCAPSPTALDSPIGRRTFLAQSALLAAAAALAACGGSGGDVTAPTSVPTTTLRVADYATLANVGGIAMITLSGNPIAVVRTGTSTFVALSRICPHQGSTVNQSGSGFLCPNHGAQFSATGTWVGGERTSNMRSYATAYDATAGTITIG